MTIKKLGEARIHNNGPNFSFNLKKNQKVNTNHSPCNITVNTWRRILLTMDNKDNQEWTLKVSQVHNYYKTKSTLIITQRINQSSPKTLKIYSNKKIIWGDSHTGDPCTSDLNSTIKKNTRISFLSIMILKMSKEYLRVTP